MTVLFPLLMVDSVTGNKVHEIAGIFIFLLFIVHNIFLNGRWYLSLTKGKYDGMRVFKTTINLLFVLIMLIMLVSAVFISQTVFSFLHADGSLLARKLHVFCACWGLILMSIHLGMHWSMIKNSIRKMTGFTATSRLYSFLVHAVALFMVSYGIKSFVSRNIAQKLIMYSAFDSWSPDESAIHIFLSYLSVIGLYACATHYILKLLQCRKNFHSKTKLMI
jgi:hypothetical protein